MKRLLTSFVTVLLTFSLTACSENTDITSSDTQNSSQSTFSSEHQSQVESSSSTSSKEIPDTTPLQYPENQGLKISLPEPVKPYQPEVKVVPLVGRYLLYRYHLNGELKFIDEKGNFIEIPPEAVKYQINDNCYLLFDKNNNLALMRYDGTMSTGFSYKALDGEDIIFCPSAGQYVKVWKTINGNNKCGVVDLITGSEVLPCEYNEIELYQRAIHAIKDEKSLLFNYKGNLIYDFKKKVILDGGYPDENIDKNYYLDDENGKIIYLGEIYIDKHEAYNELFKDNKITITDKKWNPIYTLPDRTTTIFQYWMEEIRVFGFSREIVVISQGKAIAKFPFSFEALEIPSINLIENYINKVEYKDNKLIFTIKNEPYNDETVKRFTMDQTGNIIEKEYSLKNIYVYEDNIAFQYPNKQALLDNEGNELIPYSEYDLRKRGNFVFAEFEEIETNTYKSKIYDTKGKLLLDEVYGIPSYLALPNGGVVVYTSSHDCRLLMPDGKLTTIKNAAPVTLKYTEG